jgi:tyrosyl-tRNA synthetase
LIVQGGVRIDGEKVQDYSTEVEPKEGMIVRVGKRKFIKIVRSEQ